MTVSEVQERNPVARAVIAHARTSFVPVVWATLVDRIHLVQKLFDATAVFAGLSDRLAELNVRRGNPAISSSACRCADSITDEKVKVLSTTELLGPLADTKLGIEIQLLPARRRCRTSSCSGSSRTTESNCMSPPHSGGGMQIQPVSLGMDFRSVFDPAQEAYERLIYDVLRGDAALFPRRKEVEWFRQVIDPLLAHWAGFGHPDTYPFGTAGPDGRGVRSDQTCLVLPPVAGSNR